MNLSHLVARHHVTFWPASNPNALATSGSLKTRTAEAEVHNASMKLADLTAVPNQTYVVNDAVKNWLNVYSIAICIGPRNVDV
jgi:hypothetical protein